ncbi:MAG: DNA-directed RNA polymerase subunit D [Candidatus Hadarchaeota archaeon]
MEIEIRKIEGNEMEFTLSGANPVMANAIRRAAMREVPAMAVDEVEFKSNDSAMYDEVIAHRLAMVPLKTPLEGYVLPEECGCKEGKCTKCSTELVLTGEGEATLMSGDLKPSDEEVRPTSGSIPIVTLAKGQKLELTAIARLGLGKVHAKWQPGVVAYSYMPVLEFDGKKCNACAECVKACPKEILEIEDGKVRVKDLTLCSICNSCVEVCKPGAAKVYGDPTKFIFKVESFGGLPPEQIIIRAINSLRGKFADFSKQLKKL